VRQLLEAPVLVGDLMLAPTTELAGLAELASISSTDDALAVLTRIAATIRAEDEQRDQIAALRSRDQLLPLPHRR
jgi:hypothetical protein